MQPQWEKNGLMVICRSMQMSKFKLVLFDKEGGVRIIQVATFHISIFRHFRQAVDPMISPFLLYGSSCIISR